MIDVNCMRNVMSHSLKAYVAFLHVHVQHADVSEQKKQKKHMSIIPRRILCIIQKEYDAKVGILRYHTSVLLVHCFNYVDSSFNAKQRNSQMRVRISKNNIHFIYSQKLYNGLSRISTFLNNFVFCFFFVQYHDTRFGV